MPSESHAGAARARSTSEALQRLKRGEIDLDAYLNERVDAASQHLVGLVSAEQLQFLREMLRDQLETDPVLVEFVRRATGQTPPVNVPG